jgi:hypothetical protein
MFGLVTLAACDAPRSCERAEPAPARAAEVPHTITVTGVGSAVGVPDVVSVTIGVQSRGADPSGAVADNNAKMGRILPALTGLGIAAGDVNTAGFMVSGQPDVDPQTGQALKTVTYVVDNTVQVTVREPGKLGEILGQAVAAGADNVHSVTFSLGDPKPLAREARELAIADATARAEQIARAAGVTLGRPVSVQETPQYEVYPMTTLARFTSSGPGPVPVGVGRVEQAAQVTMVFEIR